MLHAQTIELFKAIVLTPEQAVTKPQLDEATRGYVTNFVPNGPQKAALAKAFKPLPITTLYSVAERKTLDPTTLIMKQLLHYVEVYGLDQPGLFNLEVTKGKVVVIANVRGVTVDELGDLIRDLIYANAPVRNVDGVIELIRAYKISYDLALVKNNEARIRLYRAGDCFTSGDDAVRYIVFTATGGSLLIKSKEVLASVTANEKRVSLVFLMEHEAVLAQVFNRHKPIMMALKNRRTSASINRISRLSKTLHKPIVPTLNKVFIAKALNNEIEDTEEALEAIPLRDKFKFLNLLEWRRLRDSDDVFIIRNGRIHLATDRKTFGVKRIDALVKDVLAATKADLKHLKRSNILLDPHVDYGLPISQKQMLGNLPFGTHVTVEGKVISSGIYWENEWGAYDLDLSTIDESGARTGWGQFSGYAKKNPVTFSGDITSAPEGAMEFMTSPTDYGQTYGLFVNIYMGKVGSECALVVGSQTEGKAGSTLRGGTVKWIKNPVVREKVTLASCGAILGFVRNGKFVVYAARVANGRVSGSEITRRLVAKGLAPVWTVSKLLDVSGIKYDTEAVKGKKYAHNLAYGSFSIDKLENMLFNHG